MSEFNYNPIAQAAESAWGILTTNEAKRWYKSTAKAAAIDVAECFALGFVTLCAAACYAGQRTRWAVDDWIDAQMGNQPATVAVDALGALVLCPSSALAVVWEVVDAEIVDEHDSEPLLPSWPIAGYLPAACETVAALCQQLIADVATPHLEKHRQRAQNCRQSMTVRQLKAYAKKHRIAIAPNMRKADLVAAIVQNDLQHAPMA
jgi:hypothetical protein